jgi:arylsulfatase A-like enzyme
VHDVVSIVDVLPTLLELVGGSVPENIDGRSLLDSLRGDSQPSGSGTGAARGRSVAAETHGSIEMRGGATLMLRDRRYKLTSSSVSGVKETALYDLREDPGETNSIHESRPDIVDRMLGDLRQMVGELDASTPQWDQDPDVQAQLRQLGYLEE